MDKIIGRKQEKKQLNSVFESKSSEFVVIYGRHRVGKTFLVRTFFTEKRCMFFHIAGIKDGKLQDQLYEFTRILEATFYGEAVRLKEPTSWTLAFELFTQTIKQKNLHKKGAIF